VTRQDGRPRHQQIAADLRAEIMSGDLNGKLPTTQQLMETYAVGSPTVQRAVQVLKDEHFVEGRRGSGVYAVDRVAIESAPYIPAEGGYAYTLLEIAQVTPSAEVRRAFGIGGEDAVLLRRRIMTLHGDPVELSWSYYPLEIAAGTALAGKKKIKGGATLLLESLGLKPVGYQERITARLPTTAELELLELPDDVPVMRKIRVLFAGDGRPVEVTVMVKGGHRYEEHTSGII
jgi:GntR family transcriptional regulator